MTEYLHLVVGCWVALGIKPEPTRRPVDGHLSARPLSTNEIGGAGSDDCAWSRVPLRRSDQVTVDPPEAHRSERTACFRPGADSAGLPDKVQP